MEKAAKLFLLEKVNFVIQKLKKFKLSKYKTLIEEISLHDSKIIL